MEFAISSRCLSRRSLRVMASAMIAPISRTEYRAYQSENRVTDEVLQQTRPCTTCRRLQQLGLNLAARIVWGTDVCDIALGDGIGGCRRIGTGSLLLRLPK